MIIILYVLIFLFSFCSRIIKKKKLEFLTIRLIYLNFLKVPITCRKNYYITRNLILENLQNNKSLRFPICYLNSLFCYYYVNNLFYYFIIRGLNFYSKYLYSLYWCKTWRSKICPRFITRINNLIRIFCFVYKCGYYDVRKYICIKIIYFNTFHYLKICKFKYWLKVKKVSSF